MKRAPSRCEPLSIAELEKIDREGEPRDWYTGPLPDRSDIRVSAYVESEDPWDAGAGDAGA